MFYDTVKGGDYRGRESNTYRLAEVSNNIIDQCVAQGVPFARDYSGYLDNRSFGGARFLGKVSDETSSSGASERRILSRFRQDDWRDCLLPPCPVCNNWIAGHVLNTVPCRGSYGFSCRRLCHVLLLWGTRVFKFHGGANHIWVDTPSHYWLLVPSLCWLRLAVRKA